jgi:hypothetical protein
VQLRLDLQYPAARLIRGGRQLVGIHQRPPGIPETPLRTYWPPSPCTCLSHARTTTRPPPHPAAHSRQRACPPPDRLPGARATADGSHVHHNIDRPDRRSAIPRQHRHAYAVDLQRGLPTVCCTRPRS